MGTIFQQILDSEQIFKAKSNEINEKRQQIVDLENEIDKLKSYTRKCNDSNTEKRAKIENETASKEFLVKKSEILEQQLKELRAQINEIKSEHDSLLARYQKSRDDLTSFLSLQSEKIIENHANLRPIDPQKYEDFCNNKLKLEFLEKEIADINTNLGDEHNQYQDLISKLSLVKEKVSLVKSNIAHLKQDLENQQYSLSQTNHINKLKLSISNFEADIASMISEITNKKQYIHNFKNPNSQSNRTHIQRQSVHFNVSAGAPNGATYSFTRHSYNPYARPHSKPAPTQSQVSERTVVTGPSLPTSTPEEDYLFENDIISPEVLKACEEAERMNRRM